MALERVRGDEAAGADNRFYPGSFGNLTALQLSITLPDAAIEPQEATRVVALPSLEGTDAALMCRLSTRLLLESSGRRRRP
jgi:hypothetical protein